MLFDIVLRQTQTIFTPSLIIVHDIDTRLLTLLVNIGRGFKANLDSESAFLGRKSAKLLG